MSDQSRTVQNILDERLDVTQRLSALTAEHLRLSQKICGFDVLELGGLEETGAGMEQTRAALAGCEGEIETLERDMARLDQELDAKLRRDAE